MSSKRGRPAQNEPEFISQVKKFERFYERFDLSDKKLAKDLEISHTTTQKWRSGATELSPKGKRQIQRQYGVRLEYWKDGDRMLDPATSEEKPEGSTLQIKTDRLIQAAGDILFAKELTRHIVAFMEKEEEVLSNAFGELSTELKLPSHRLQEVISEEHVAQRMSDLIARVRDSYQNSVGRLEKILINAKPGDTKKTLQ